ncbi:MAG: hypothetical protein ACRD1Y_00170 [Terriglobales bacterium]
MASTPMGVAARSEAPLRYRTIGNFLVPHSAAAEAWYWQHLHRQQHLPRRSWLARWQPGAGQAVPWAAQEQARLSELLGGAVQCIWRPAAPGISRATLAWLVEDHRLRAVARTARGPHCSFLEREWDALRHLEQVPGLAASTPGLLWAEREAGAGEEQRRLLLLESACEGEAVAPWRAEAPSHAAASWLAGFQFSAAARAPYSPIALLAALAAQPRAAAFPGTPVALTAFARERLRVRALSAPAAPRVPAHGDYWWGNVLLGGAGEISVVDWSEFRLDMHPYHDPGFYLLTWGRDWAQRRRRLPPATWLRLAFVPGSRFLMLAARWFDAYRAALARAAWSRGLEPDFNALLRYLPVVMAHYACHGQQAAAWTAACNTWAASDGLVF